MTQTEKNRLKKIGNTLGMIFFAVFGVLLIVAGFYSSILKGFMLTDRETIDYKLQIILVFSGIISLYMTVKFKVIAAAVVGFFTKRINKL